ncbi:MAG: division/cell wall cluster transcriptional repressor MraZ [Marinilabiliaceae bacterium]|nr:division/cell wall cluster transcriptional repressor MraZ [Marinilabiliaceae bacterium]
MSSFIGDYTVKIDAKSRIVMPASFKRALEEMGQDRLVVKKDIFEDCLVLLPYSVWERQMEELRQKLNVYNREHAQLLREFQKNMAELTLDANGRFLLPKRLVDMANIEKDVTLLGMDLQIELWNSELYAQQSKAISSDALAQMAQTILGH